jgi:hypothetical protein
VSGCVNGGLAREGQPIEHVSAPTCGAALTTFRRLLNHDAPYVAPG